MGHETPALWIWAVAAVVVLALVGLVVLLRRGRRAPTLPPEEKKPEEQRAGLKLVPAEAPEAKPAPPVEAPAAKPLKEGLAKTRGGFISRIGGLLGKKQID